MTQLTKLTSQTHAAGYYLAFRHIPRISTFITLGILALSHRSGADEMQSQEPIPLSHSPNWSTIYSNSLAGGKLAGTKEDLLTAIEQKRPIGISWMSFHGVMSAECTSVSTDALGRVTCHSQVWCDSWIDNIPRRHGHRVEATSGGNVSSVILTQDGTGQLQIWDIAHGHSAIQWFADSRSAESSQAPVASAR